MNAVLWVLQILLALFNLAGGGWKVMNPAEAEKRRYGLSETIGGPPLPGRVRPPCCTGWTPSRQTQGDWRRSFATTARRASCRRRFASTTTNPA